MPDKPNNPDPAALPAPETLSYEDAIDTLEAIVERIEGGEIGLAESMTQYERGVALIARCRAVLGQAEQRIAELDLNAESGTNGAGGSSAEPDRTD